MKVLTITTLYPNNREPKHGIFVRNRLNHLRQSYPQVNATVIAPVPWFPVSINWGPFAEYQKFVGVQPLEKRDGVDVYHPRYLVIPKIGMYVTPFFLFISLWWALRRLKKQGFRYDLIDGHYFFPDGVAVALLAKLENKPFTITARGTDVNLIPKFPLAKRMVRWVASSAGGVVTVCKALLDELLAFAPVGGKAKVLRNGVDLTFFSPGEDAQRKPFRADQGINDKHKLLISVGHLIERKGHHLAIDALRSIPDATLVIIGDGAMEVALRKSAEECGVANRVKFTGALAQEQLRQWYQFADALILASSREGWANVLLESMACGTPVVATNLWGTPEVVGSPEAGVLVSRDPASIANGVNQLFSAHIDRQKTRSYAEQFDWSPTSDGQWNMFQALIIKEPGQ